ncbi:MAG TPA: AAA family ATPase, partial [Anaerolineae bacterium]
PRHISTSATYPEEPALRQMLDHWQTLVMDAVKDLQGRAALISELKTKRVTYAAKLPLTLTVRNDGFNVAQSVRVMVNDAEGYRVIEGGQQQIDLLTRGSTRDVEVTIEPLAHDRLRLVWQLVYNDSVDAQRQVEFADVIEFIETKAPAASFVRIFPIPYVTGMPLKTNNLFVGRQDVFAYIKEHLFGAYQNNVIVLHGQRRTGKTSILYRLKDVLAETHVCVLVDMQGKAARGTLDFLYSLADDIVYTLEDHGCTANLPPRSDFAESPEFVFRSRFLRGVYDVLPVDSNGKQKHLLLMFDEFEELQKRVEDGKLEAEIFPFLRNLMQHEDPLDFVFAGTHKLEELGAEYWSILFNIASYKKITFLTPDDARRLITEPVAPNLEYDPLAIDRIYSVTGG